MKVPQLEPLVEAAAELAGRADVDDIVEFIRTGAEAAGSPAMAQSLCERVIDLCHPRAWGDRNVVGFTLTEWDSLLGRLAHTASACGQAIFDAQSDSR